MKNRKKIILFCAIVVFGVCCLWGCIDLKQTNKNADMATTSQATGKDEQKNDFDINEYENTIWASNDSKSNTYVLEINTLEDNSISFWLKYFECDNFGHIAEIYKIVECDDINGNNLSFDFYNDGYNHSGTVNMIFKGNGISVKITDVKTSGNFDWGFVEDSFILKEDSSVYDDLQSDFEYEQESTLSKASGILKSMGVTAEDFKQSCSYISNNDYAYVYDSDTRTAHVEYPDYTYKQLRQYPAQYVNLCCFDDNLRVYSKDKSSDGYTIYNVKDADSYKGDIILFDKRDDIYSPTISIDDSIVPYMIFKGVQTIDGIDYVCFDLIAVR